MNWPTAAVRDRRNQPLAMATKQPSTQELFSPHSHCGAQREALNKALRYFNIDETSFTAWDIDRDRTTLYINNLPLANLSRVNSSTFDEGRWFGKKACRSCFGNWHPVQNNWTDARPPQSTMPLFYYVKREIARHVILDRDIPIFAIASKRVLEERFRNTVGQVVSGELVLQCHDELLNS